MRNIYLSYRIFDRRSPSSVNEMLESQDQTSSIEQPKSIDSETKDIKLETLRSELASIELELEELIVEDTKLDVKSSGLESESIKSWIVKKLEATEKEKEIKEAIKSLESRLVIIISGLAESSSELWIAKRLKSRLSIISEKSTKRLMSIRSDLKKMLSILRLINPDIIKI